MAEVELSGVYKIYDGGVTAVLDANLAVRDGEFVVLVGPSGCGKSTTLRMVAGLEDISKGEIRIGGRMVNDVAPKDRDIAMVFQNYALYPHMTVYDNMAFGLKLRKMPKAEIDRRVRDASSVLELDDYLTRRPKALSGGQRQRVAMGRAIVREPAVFLFDEPLSNLDAKMRVEMRREILQLHRRVGATMLYVTHDQIEAMTLGDRIVVMKDGVIEQVGPPTEVFDHPATLFVAGFIGTPPMNLLEGVLRREGQGFVFDGGALSTPLPERMAPALASYAGRPVVLGLRPRAFSRADGPGGTGKPCFAVMVEMTEMLGEEVLVHLTSGGHRLRVSADQHTSWPVGQTVSITPHLNHAHVFYVETGKNLTASDTSKTKAINNGTWPFVLPAQSHA